MLHLLLSIAMAAGECVCEQAEDPVSYRAFAHDFATGSYKSSSGLESVTDLLIDRNNDEFRFKYDLKFDDGGSFVAAGPVRFVGDWIELVVETLEQNRDFEIYGKHYAVKDVLKGKVLKVDNRIYFILEDDLARFCNELNLGTDPQQSTEGRYFVRELGDKGPVTPTPELPPDVAKMIIAKPLVGEVLSVEDGRARISLGERDRVWKGMLLYCEPDETTKRELFGERKEDPKKHRALLRVVDVRDTSCVAEIRGVPPIKKSAPIRQGYKVYSKIPDSASKFGIRTLFFQ
jgi:hypothetical protein